MSLWKRIVKYKLFPGVILLLFSVLLSGVLYFFLESRYVQDCFKLSKEKICKKERKCKTYFFWTPSEEKLCHGNKSCLLNDPEEFQRLKIWFEKKNVYKWSRVHQFGSFNDSPYMSPGYLWKIEDKNRVMDGRKEIASAIYTVFGGERVGHEVSIQVK